MVVGLQQVAAAMTHIHNQALVHHDLRAGNVMLAQGGGPWCIIDMAKQPLCPGMEPPTFSL